MNYYLCPRCKFRIASSKYICSTCGFKVLPASDTKSGVSDDSHKAAKPNLLGKIFNVEQRANKPSDSAAEKPVLG
jgi:DNA-directed RNA polymerase subunit RPC12/RpoP